ncbi:serine hydrolase domain-containing protein [Kordiimonas aestuarii]|uniref:serine hydrolase domain-containing protein n=1 Tax=Kordiimonas aestuarii TaxID=1005925 RepID=UPI0021D162B5|nr:serine hydrolase domain-containing protein [Kordiimonas aestuarii]
MRTMIRTVSLALACAVSFQTGAADSDFDQAWTSVERRFDARMAEVGTVGATLVFLQNGKILARHNYGLADKESGRAVGTDTVFHWASITKTFTATALMQLRDRGKLSLDDPISKYLPEVRQVYNPYGSMDDITLRQLISHAAGFRSPTFPWGGGEKWHPFEPAAWSQVAAMMPYSRIHFEPGSRFAYSNPGISMLGRVVEIVSGDTIEEYVSKNILMPLGMTRSYFDTTPYHLLKDRSNSYWLKGNKLSAYGLDFDTGATSGNGGLNAPVADMVKWLNAWLGLDDSAPEILQRETFDEMWQTLYPTDDTSVAEYMGMVFFTIQVPESETHIPFRLVGHTGDQAGFTAFVYVEPDSKTAAIYNNNTASDTAFKTREIIRADVIQTLFPLFVTE